MKLKQIICIALVLVLGICLLSACGPKEENHTEESNSEIIIDEEAVNEFKDKYGDKLPWFGSGSSDKKPSGGIQET